MHHNPTYQKNRQIKGIAAMVLILGLFVIIIDVNVLANNTVVGCRHTNNR